MFKLKIYVKYTTKPSDEKKTGGWVKLSTFVEVAPLNIFSCGTCTSDSASILETDAQLRCAAHSRTKLCSIFTTLYMDFANGLKMKRARVLTCLPSNYPVKIHNRLTQSCFLSHHKKPIYPELAA